MNISHWKKKWWLFGPNPTTHISFYSCSVLYIFLWIFRLKPKYHLSFFWPTFSTHPLSLLLHPIFFSHIFFLFFFTTLSSKQIAFQFSWTSLILFFLSFWSKKLFGLQWKNLDSYTYLNIFFKFWLVRTRFCTAHINNIFYNEIVYFLQVHIYI